MASDLHCRGQKCASCQRATLLDDKKKVQLATPGLAFSAGVLDKPKTACPPQPTKPVLPSPQTRRRTVGGESVTKL